MIEIQVPEAAAGILEELNAHGFEAYVVGGCVRDSLLGRMPEDWDITTSATPEEVKKIFKRTIDTGISHGTVTVMADHTGYEVTTYRIDGEYEDGRHPRTVEFTRSLEEDLKRRDFTINAMAYNKEKGLVDAFGGLQDLKDHIIRCVGNPLDRFTEDALRILRALRFSAQLGFTVESGTKKAIREIAPNLAKVSRERIAVELTKLLLSDNPWQMKAVWETGIGPYVSDRFNMALKRLSQAEKIGYLPASKHMRWAGFLRMEAPGDAWAILKELKMDNETMDQVKTLVSLWRQQIPAQKPLLRRLMSRLTDQGFDDLLCFQKVFGGEQLLEELSRAEAYSLEIRQSGDCIRLKDLAVTGRDLMGAGMKPGPEMGRVLNHLFEEVLERPECNCRDFLMNRYKELKK